MFELEALKGELAKKLIITMILVSSVLALLITCVQLYVDYRYDIASVENELIDIEAGYSESITESVWVLHDEQI